MIGRHWTVTTRCYKRLSILLPVSFLSVWRKRGEKAAGGLREEGAFADFTLTV